jgi:hypothetical protein
MMSIKFDWLKPMNRHGIAAGADCITVQISTAGKSKAGEQAYQWRATIPEEAMKAARFVVGDRAEIGFAQDEEKGLCFGIRRVVSGGYSITAATTAKHKELMGKPVRGRIQATYRKEMPETFTSDEGGYEITPEGMIMAWEGKK